MKKHVTKSIFCMHAQMLCLVPSLDLEFKEVLLSVYSTGSTGQWKSTCTECRRFWVRSIALNYENKMEKRSGYINLLLFHIEDKSVLTKVSQM